MARVSTFAAAMGVVAGAWNLYAFYFLACHGLCPAWTSTPPGFQGSLTAGLALLLLLVSLGEFVGPMMLFYLSALFGLAIDAIEVLNYSTLGQGAFFATVILVTLSVALSVAAARRKTGVSEQSNPMNLPIFG